MANHTQKHPADLKPKLALTLDTWAVVIAVGLAVLVRAGWLKHIPW